MEWLFFVIFGGLLLFFIGYAFWMFKQDKKIINEISNKENGRVLGGSNLSEEEMGVQHSERPFVDGYKSTN